MDSKISRLRKKPINELTDAELTLLTLDGNVVVTMEGRGERITLTGEPRKHKGGRPREGKSVAIAAEKLKRKGKTWRQIKAKIDQESKTHLSTDAYRKRVERLKSKKK
jgi:hypothetical protein